MPHAPAALVLAATLFGVLAAPAAGRPLCPRALDPERAPGRAIVLRWEGAAAGAEAAVRPLGAVVPLEVAVSAEEPDAVRVLVGDPATRVLLRVPRANLADVTTRTVIGRPAPDAPERDEAPGLLLAPGCRVTRGAVASGLVEVTVEDAAPLVDVHGYVPADALGTVWAAGKAPERPSPSDAIRPGTLVRVGSDGPVLARVPDDAPREGVGVDVVRRDGDLVWVEVEASRVRVRGAVPATALVGERPPIRVWGKSGRGVVGRESVTLPAGTLLRDRADGDVVACLVARADLSRAGGPDAHGQVFVTLEGPFGAVDLAWDASRAAFAKGTFGALVRRGAFWHLEGSPTRCVRYVVRREAETPFAGDLELRTRTRAGRRARCGYSYEYAPGRLTLLGPGGERAETDGTATWGSGGMDDLSLAARGGEAIVGGEPWFASKAACEAARDRGGSAGQPLCTP